MKSPLIPLLIFSLCLASSAFGADYHWDINGTVPGAGGSAPTGNWNTSTAYWNTDTTGGADGVVTQWINGNAVILSAGSDATGSFTLTPDATVTSISSLLLRNGTGSQVVTIANGATINNTSGIIDVQGVGTRLSFRSVLTGSAGLIKRGSGILETNTSTPTYTGDTVIEEGVLRITQAGRIPTGTLVNVHDGAFFDVRGNSTIAGLTGAGAVRNGLSSSTITLTLNTASGIQTFSGVLDLPSSTGILNLTKNGAYEQRLTGTTANTFTGNTTVTAGVLALGKTAGVNAIAAGALIIDGGSVRLDASHQIADGVNLRLNGGTFSTGAATGETVGTLQLENDSFLDLGTGGVALSFAGSSALEWDGSLLTISNFTLGVDTLRFGTDATGLNADQLALLRFSDYGGVGGFIDAAGYVTPIPEPSAIALVALLALPLLGRRWKTR